MNIIKFIYKCHKIKNEIKRDYKSKGMTGGLCFCLQHEISISAKAYFASNFRYTAPYIGDMFWLGPLRSTEGYNNRLEYLKRFRNLAIKTREYRKW